MPAALRSHPVDNWVPARGQANRRAGRATWAGGARAIGLLALTTSVLYFISDLIEVMQGGFSTGQLWFTLVGEAAVPVFVIGLWLVQRPRTARLGAVSAIAYAYCFVFFTGTVVYAMVDGTRDFEHLTEALSPAMTIHGALMVLAGVGFGYAVSRAGVLPRWTGTALAVGVALIPLSTDMAGALGLLGVGIRDLAFAGMGAALVRGRRGSSEA